MDCKIEIFSQREFRVLSQERRIYLLGERGVFLSLVDILLDDEDKMELEQSVISECWGRAVVTKYNVKIMYQDWRSEYFDTRTAEETVVCHNEKVVREGGSLLFNSGIRVWEEMFRDEATWPHVVLMSTGKNQLYDVHEFIGRLPSEWEGTLFLTDGAFSARMAGRGYSSDYEEYRSKLQELTYSSKDSRVRWLDGMGLSRDMIMYGEFGPEHATLSKHFHAHCDATYQDVDGELKSMRVCSNVTENVAQLLIGHALGPKAALMTNDLPVNALHPSPPSSDLVMCHSCPKDLLPFHITPYPDMSCIVGPLHAKTETEIGGQIQMCPEQCMEVEVKRKFGSQSNQIYERHCPYNFFPRGFQVGNDSMRSGLVEYEEIGFGGRMVWMFNIVLVASLLGYQHRGKIRARLIKVLDPSGSVSGTHVA
jgi:hypothetical protein